MDINAERQEAIKRLDQITDPTVIRAVRYLIDLGLASQAAKAEAASTSQPIPQPAEEVSHTSHS